MTFGLSFSNSSNVVVLDSEYSRLCVVYSGRYIGNSMNGYAFSLSFPAPITTVEQPLLFIRPDTVSGLLKMGGASVVGSPGNWTGITGRMYDQVGYTAAGSYFICIFGANSVATFGLRLFDATAKPIFDSGTPTALFTRGFQNWTYLRSDQGAQGNWRNYYNVPFSFPVGEYLLMNAFSMRMLNGDNVGRAIHSWWDFTNQTLYAVTDALYSNPYAFFMPAMFAKMNN